jgi:trk system potassium uptake protein TrkH
MLGGLGFQVMRDLLLFKWVNRVHVDTKIVVTLSVILWVLGSVVILALENNSSHFQAIPLSEKIINSSFQSVTARAAGFSTIPFYEVVPATSFIVMLLMFIGTASASTGGGIRLNTLGILLSTALASVRGREHVTCFRREIDSRQVNRAITITFFASALVFTVAFILSFTEQGGLKFIYLLFEVCSAVGTVGLSSGITPGLSAVGQIMIIITMFAGRLIPLVLGLSLIDKERKPTPYRYPQERVRIG